MMGELDSRLGDSGIRFGIGGYGWRRFKVRSPSQWSFPGELHGRSYTEWLRQARICIAPLAGSAVSDGALHPGDEDTTRTYELAASNCFFIHRRTKYVQEIYDEISEVPMYSSAEELAELIRHFLARPEERLAHADAAHRRAVPQYGIDRRAGQIVELLETLLNR